MQAWYPDTYMNYRIPYDRTPANADDRANKVAFIYSGFTYGNGNGLHPRAWRMRSCYVTGERHGGDLNGHQSHPSGPDQSLRFSAIGIHAHEIGHLLPLSHGNGVFFDRDQNPYTGDSFLQTNVAANFMSWCAMQSGSDGPLVQGGYQDEDDTSTAYMYVFRSCPAPYNPGYMKDLGWGSHTEITFNRSEPRSLSRRLGGTTMSSFQVIINLYPLNSDPWKRSGSISHGTSSPKLRGY